MAIELHAGPTELYLLKGTFFVFFEDCWVIILQDCKADAFELFCGVIDNVVALYKGKLGRSLVDCGIVFSSSSGLYPVLVSDEGRRLSLEETEQRLEGGEGLIVFGSAFSAEESSILSSGSRVG